MDERHVVAAPESISFSYDIAGIGSRFMAAFVDFPACFIIAIGVSILYGYGQINQRIFDPALSSAGGGGLHRLYIRLVLGVLHPV